MTGSPWTNDDGLNVLFGTDKALVAKEGATASLDSEREIVIELSGADLPTTTDGETFINTVPMAYIPNGALLRSATLIVTTAFVGATATLSLGTAQNDGTTIDADGIDATIAITAIDAVGDEIACDGALIGTKVAADSYITATVGTANITAGEGKLVIKYIVE